MAKHQLFLDFPDNTNEGILRVEDSSIYNSIIPITCVTLEITPPGYNTPTVYTNLTPQWRLFLNACTLGILATGCDENCPLIPDGIYGFRYSVSPNATVFIEYQMLRIVRILNKWYKTLCWINNTPLDPLNDQLVLLREMELIKNQILTAKHLVEDIHDYSTGVQMYQYAKRKLEDISQGCNFCH